MNLTQVKQNIQTGNFSPVYIFTGEELGVMDIYISQISKASKKTVAYMDTFKQVFSVVNGQSVVQSEGHVYIVRDDKEVLENVKIWEILNNAGWKDIVILIFTSLDKRTSFYKRYKDSICVFEPLEDTVLVKYIKKAIPLSDKNCQTLIEVCEHSYSRIMLEIDKIKGYTLGMGYTLDDKVYNHVLRELLDNGAIYKPAQDSIFLWSDAVMYRNREQAFQYTEDCFASGEAVLTMVTVLYNNVKQTLQVQSFEGSDITRSTGLTGWQVQCVKKFLNNYSTGELLDAMELLREMEMGIKMGKIEESFVIPYILTNML